VFLPTLLECFSASYAEAMAMEKPILTSDLGFARSICGKAAIYGHPTDANGYAVKINRLMRDPSLQKEVTEAGREQLNKFLTAEERAAVYLERCRSLIKGKDNPIGLY
jgi:glycosyltransferase involved in cell wall biosynthesis